MPPIFRAVGLETPPTPMTPIRLTHPARTPPSFFSEDTHEDDEDPMDDLMRPPSLPGLHGGDPLNPGSASSSEPPAAEHGKGKTAVRVGLARHGLKLRERPGEGTEITGAVRAGEVVMIMKDLGEWVLIMHSGDDDVSMGWTKRSEIAIR